MGGFIVSRNKMGFTALIAAAAIAAGCASVDASTEKAAASKTAKAQGVQQEEVEVGYITGSRIPRKATQNTQGVKQTTSQDWQRYQPPNPLKGD